MALTATVELERCLAHSALCIQASQTICELRNVENLYFVSESVFLNQLFEWIVKCNLFFEIDFL